MKHRLGILAATVAGMAIVLYLTPIQGAAGMEPNLVWKGDATMHAHFTNSFLGSDGNGWSRMLAPPMEVTDFMWLTTATGTYKLGTIELIGIAKHQSPVAFVSLRHRSFSNPETRETRALTVFETEALDRLRAGTDVITETRRNARTVVGALRAQQSCLGCHSTFQIGDVLGALSYRLDAATLPSSLTVVASSD